MKIGISSWTYGWAVGRPGFDTPSCPLQLFDLLDRAMRLGVQVLQIADNLPLVERSEEELIKLSVLAHGGNIELEVGTRGLERNNLLRYLAIAQKLGAKLVRTLPHDGDDKPTLEEAIDRVEAVLPDFQRAGIVLGIENHDFYQSMWLRSLMTHFQDKHLGICLDTVNSFGQGESYREVVSALAEYAVNFHCKDYVFMRKPSTLGFDLIGTPVGSGLLDFADAKRRLPEDISWIVELWTPYQGNIASTVALENSWAEQSVAALKHLQNG